MRVELRRSLRFRFAAASFVTAIVLVVALGFTLQGVLERHVERAVLEEVRADLRFLSDGLVVEDGTARLALEPLPDPRFQEPLSGLYWQVSNDRSGAPIRSASLAGFTIPLAPDDLPAGIVHRHVELGPERSKLIVLEQRVSDVDPDLAAYRFVVAVDREVIEAGYEAIVRDIAPILGVAAIGLVIASAFQAWIAFSPVTAARRALSDLRAGRRDRLDEALPLELAGFGRDFDLLLAAQRERVKRAKARAADLAHGLKTPLALLAVRARELHDRGQPEIAREIEETLRSLNVRVTRELARARIHGPSGPGEGGTQLAPLVSRIVGTISRLSNERSLHWSVDVEERLLLPVDEHDLTELLGVLAENAAKWAVSRVRISAARNGGCWTLLVEDDGPGIPPEARQAALERGSGLDPTRSEAGLGLAIAQDIAAAYSGRLSLESSPLGGLRVSVLFGEQ